MGHLKDIAQNFVRNQLAGVPGASIPQPFGGPWRQIQLYVDPYKLEARQMSPMDVVRSMNQANLILPAGDVQIGNLDYDIYSNAQFNLKNASQYPVKMNGENPVLMSDIGVLKDAHALQYNVVHVNGQRSVYLPVLKQGGNSNTITVVVRHAQRPAPPGRCAFGNADRRWSSISHDLSAPRSRPCCMKAASGCFSPA